MRYFNFLLTVWLFVIVIYPASAQISDGEYGKRYTGAKLLYSQGKYNLAMEAFKPLIQADDANPYATYSSFYYGISAYREGYLALSKNMFLQIRQLYPNWSKIDEVNLWLSTLYFENKEYNSALESASRVGAKQKEFAQKLKRYHLSDIQDVEFLQQLYESTKDEIVGEVLAKRIAAEPLATRDQALLDRLIRKFDLDTEALNISQVSETVFKDTYRVAVLLPLVVEALEPTDRPKANQFVLDFYEGIRLAIDSLQKTGIDIKLYAYDTKRSKATTSKILELDELKSMDLIIGPVYNDPIKLVTEFGYRNRINVINPFYANSEVIGNNPFSFLLKPTHETVGVKAAEYVAQHARNKTGIILYGTAPADSVMAYTYKKRIEKDSFNIIITKKIRKDSSRDILDMLLISSGRIKDASTEGAKDNFNLAVDSVGHIFVASNNDLISSKVMSAVETRGDSIMVVGSADWLQLSAINYDTYGRLGAVLYAPGYMPKDTLGYAKFRDQYVQRLKKSPSSFAESGFELMMFMGNSLNKFGKYFQLGWNEQGYMPGIISYGYNFQYSNANHIVPFLNFRGDKMQVILKQEDEIEDAN